ncbi:c-type cytochrome biogenesis protein CcmI [Alphaproteobacteria bacterium]|nr:c-type cytochrome biogenesis protein CcmI [Alphaproteobacteria bacterium]
MLLWIIILFIIFCVIGFLSLPLILTKNKNKSREEYDLAVYSNQLNELKKDMKVGLVSSEDEKAATAEISRKILLTNSLLNDKSNSNEENKSLNLAFLLIIIFIIPIVSINIYFLIGNPKIQNSPFVKNLLIERTNETTTAGLNESILKLKERLESDQNDYEGWILLGRSYLIINSPSLATEAFEKAINLDPNKSEAYAFLGESIVFSSSGIVTPRALKAFKKVIRADKFNPAARFYIGLANSQAGNKETALNQWIELAKDTDQDAPWLPTLKKQIEKTSAELGVKPEDSLIASGNSSLNQRGPSKEDIESAKNMSSEERMNMIRGMVNSLAERLKDNPNDLQGWERLARSYTVLGEKDLAKKAQEKITELKNSSLNQKNSKTFNSKTKEVIQGLEERIKRNPSDKEAWLWLGQSYSLLEDHENAKITLKKASELWPSDTEVLIHYGRSIINSSPENSLLSEKVLDLYNYVLNIEPNNIEAMYFIAIGLSQKGDNSGALNLYKKLLLLVDKNSELYEKIIQRIRKLEP